MDYDQLDVVLRADSEERNPDVLRAEMSVLTTQSSVQFSADAYAAIQNVQAQCAADLKNMCSSEQIKLENRLVDDKLMTRRLSEQGSGMQMIKAIQSLYRHNSDNLINPSFVPRFLREKSKTSLKTVKDASADTAAAPSALAFPSAGVPRSSGGMKSLNLSPGPVIKKVNDVSADSGAADGAAPAGGPRGGPMAGGRGAGGRGFGSGRGGGRMAGGRGGFGGRGSEAAAESVGLAALENTDAAVAAESNGGTFVPVGGRGAGRGGAANGRGMGRMGGRGQQPNQKQQPPQAQQQQLPPQMQPVPQQALPLTQSNVPSAAMPTTKGGSGSLVPQQQQTNGEGVVGAIKSIFVPGTTSTAAAPAVGAAPSTPNVKPAPPARVRPAAPVTTAAPPAAATAAADAAATAAAAAGPIHHHHSTVPIPVAPAAPAAVVTAPAAATTSAAPAAGKATAAATPAVPVAAKTVATPATAAAAPVAAKAPAAPAAPAKTVPAPVAPAAAPPKTAAVTPAAPAANGAAAAADADANVAVRPATEQGGPRLRGGHKRPNGGGATVAAAGRRTTATKRQQQPLHWHESDSEGSEGEGDRHHRGGPPPPKEGGRPGCGRPRHLTGPRAAPGMLGMHPHDHHEHEGREGEWGRPHDEEPEGPPCEEQEGGPEGGWWAPPPMEQEEDLLYTGALGYGPSADLCMHQHYEQLSQPCAQAIDDLYQVREQFWQSATAPPPPPHHHGVLLLLLGVVLVACGVRRCVRRGKVQKIRTFMNAIRGNAALKATVERETGLAVPEPVCPQHQQPCKKSWRCRLACAVTLVLSFLLAVDITGHVLHHMDERAAEQGEEPACPGKAIGILIGVFVVELLALFALIKTGKWVKRTFFASSSSSAVTVEPSAPVFTGDGYAPLPQGDDIDHMPATEMTTMRPITSTTTKMVMPSGAVVLVPVSAAPVSSVRMV